MKEVKLLHLRVCNSCNLACPYCVMSAGRGDARAEAMTAAQALGILRLFLAHASAPRVAVEISGGEPLLCGSRWLEAVCGGLRTMQAKYVKQVILRITTNGTLLDAEVIGIFRNYKVDVCIGVDTTAGVSGGVKTLDGRVRNAIELLQRLYTAPAINAVATQPAVRGAVRFMSELRQMNIRRFRLTAVNNRGRASSAPWLVPTPEQVLACTMRLIRYMDRCDFSIVETSALDRVYRYMGDLYEPNFCHAPTCPAGSGFLAVDRRGDIYPCGNETRERFRMGNIYEGVDERRTSRVLSEYHGQLAAFVRCAYCRAGRMCHYGCPGCMHDGGSTHFDSECRVTQTLFEHFERNRDVVQGICERAKSKAPIAAMRAT